MRRQSLLFRRLGAVFAPLPHDFDQDGSVFQNARLPLLTQQLHLHLLAHFRQVHRQIREADALLHLVPEGARRGVADDLAVEPNAFVPVAIRTVLRRERKGQLEKLFYAVNATLKS